MNIHNAIIEGSKILKDNFIDSANLDSEILMAKAIQKNRKYVLLNPEIDLKKKNLNKFKNLIKERSLRKPIAYLTNKIF